MAIDLPTYTLNDENTLPVIGLGTYGLTGEDGITAMVHAIEAGYRLLDTAVRYGNQREVGEAIRRSGLPREQLQVTTKIPGADHGYDDALASIRSSLQELALEYIDLHLIHWPNPRVGSYPQAWRALVTAREQGLVKSVGVSNFTEEHLHRIIDDSGVTPTLNQIELHPYFPQEQMRAVHDELGIRTEAWSPTGKRQAPFGERVVSEPASKYDVSPAQVLMRWHYQLGSLPIPKSATPSRQLQNIDIFDFELTDQEMGAITALGREDGRLFDGDPTTHEEM